MSGDTMDFSKPFKTESIPQSAPSVKKCVEEKTPLPKQIVDFLRTLKTASTKDVITALLQKNTQEELDENIFKTDNILFNQTNYVIADAAEPMIKKINALGLNSIPKLIYKFDNNETDKVLVFSVNTKDKLMPFNPKTATDRAKSELYEDIKTLADKKYVDFEDIQDTSKWYQTEDGTHIYILNPNIGGYLEDAKIEKLKQNVFNTLFNGK